MKIHQTSLPEVVLIEPKVFGDERGFFLETWVESRYSEAGIRCHFVQDNHSRSQYGVLRGLHYQREFPQGKLVRVVSGEVFDVAVDIRVGSPHFGQWFGTLLTEKNQHQLYVPPGFAHGFCVLSKQADFLYKCTDYYHPEDEAGILWSDPDIAITWGLDTPSLSEKDTLYSKLCDIDESQLPRYT
ncbi:MAG: dTDP-4-dehydrorhamnose 3,5-epimerase [Mariprofundaceae bacterium]